MHRILLAALLSLMIITPITLLESNDNPSVDFASIQITEIDYNGYTSFDNTETSATKEAIEITNTSTQNIDLIDWQLRIVSGNTDKSLILPDESLAPSEVFVFVRGLEIPESLKGMTYTGSLDNTQGAFIELRDGRGVTIDSFNQYGEWTQSLEAETDSLQKISSRWKSCPATLGLRNTCIQREIPSEEEPESENSPPSEESPIPDEKEDKTITSRPEEFTLRINEILPNPEGSDIDFEFVEIYNFGEKEIHLENILLDDIRDGGSSAQKLTGVVSPQSYYLLQGNELEIALNNSGDEVYLIHESTQTIIDSLSYTKDHVFEGKSLEKTDEVVHILDIPTPGKENLPNANPPESAKPSKEQEEKTSSEEVPFKLKKGVILINEILPNPEGKDTEGEFIELQNTSSEKVSLDNWKFRIDTKSFTFQDISIEGEELLAIFRPETKLTLSNSKTFTLELIAPTGEIYDSVTILKQEDHHSFAKHRNEWSWTSTPSPDTENQITQEPQTASQKEENIPEITLNEIYNQEHNTKLTTTGIVIRDSTLNAKYVYISNGEDIMKVYSTKKELGSLRSGQQIQVTGTWFTNENNTYLRIKDFSEDISILNTTHIPNHPANLSSNIDLLPLFHNVIITGIVDNQSGRTWNLITPDETIKVELAKDLDLTKPDFSKGDTMTVTGFIDIERGVRRVVLTNTATIQITLKQEEKIEDESNEEITNDKIPSDEDTSTTLSSIMQARLTSTIPQVFKVIQPILNHPVFQGGTVLTITTIGGIFLIKYLKKQQ